VRLGEAWAPMAHLITNGGKNVATISQIYKFTLTGQTPLLPHADNVELADDLMAWRKDPQNKNITVAGDDRSPAWTWKTYLYSDEEYISIPTEAIMAAIRKAGASIVLKGQKTFKSITQCGIVLSEPHIPLIVGGNLIAVSDIDEIDGTFAEQAQAVKSLGFRLFVKRAKIGSSKHVRVRARFDEWSAVGNVMVTAQEITEPILREMFEIAGFYVGLCDWRPSAPKSPGPFGRFTAELEKID